VREVRVGPVLRVDSPQRSPPRPSTPAPGAVVVTAPTGSSSARLPTALPASGLWLPSTSCEAAPNPESLRQRSLTPTVVQRRCSTKPRAFPSGTTMAPCQPLLRGGVPVNDAGSISPRPPARIANPSDEMELRRRLQAMKQELMSTFGALARVEARLQEAAAENGAAMPQPSSRRMVVVQDLCGVDGAPRRPASVERSRPHVGIGGNVLRGVSPVPTPGVVSARRLSESPPPAARSRPVSPGPAARWYSIPNPTVAVVKRSTSCDPGRPAARREALSSPLRTPSWSANGEVVSPTAWRPMTARPATSLAVKPPRAMSAFTPPACAPLLCSSSVPSFGVGWPGGGLQGPVLPPQREARSPSPFVAKRVVPLAPPLGLVPRASSPTVSVGAMVQSARSVCVGSTLQRLSSSPTTVGSSVAPVPPVLNASRVRRQSSPPVRMRSSNASASTGRRTIRPLGRAGGEGARARDIGSGMGEPEGDEAFVNGHPTGEITETLSSGYPVEPLIGKIVDELLQRPPPLLAAARWTPSALKRHLSSILCHVMGRTEAGSAEQQRPFFYLESDRTLVDALDSQSSWAAFEDAVRNACKGSDASGAIATKLLAAVRCTLALHRADCESHAHDSGFVASEPRGDAYSSSAAAAREHVMPVASGTRPSAGWEPQPKPKLVQGPHGMSSAAADDNATISTAAVDSEGEPLVASTHDANRSSDSAPSSSAAGPRGTVIRILGQASSHSGASANDVAHTYRAGEGSSAERAAGGSATFTAEGSETPRPQRSTAIPPPPTSPPPSLARRSPVSQGEEAGRRGESVGRASRGGGSVGVRVRGGDVAARQRAEAISNRRRSPTNSSSLSQRKRPSTTRAAWVD